MKFKPSTFCPEDITLSRSSNTCECIPEVLSEFLGVAEFGGEPNESLRGGLDFDVEYVLSDNEPGSLSTHGDGDVTVVFSECFRSLGLCPGI